jgi:hypothetical protein
MDLTAWFGPHGVFSSGGAAHIFGSGSVREAQSSWYSLFLGLFFGLPGSLLIKAEAVEKPAFWVLRSRTPTAHRWSPPVVDFFFFFLFLGLKLDRP